MSDTTTSTRPGTLAGPRELRELDAGTVIRAVVERRRAADQAEADLLALAVHFVDLHPVTDDTDTAAFVLSKPIAGPPTRVPLAGVGTPQVAQFAVEELGAALHVGYRAALRLVADSLELCYRLPRLWALVQAGQLQTWRARQVAHETTHLSPAAVAFVDRHVAITAVRNRIPANLPALVHEALLQCDPETALGREEAALSRRDVMFDYRESTATASMTATLDTLDALDLDATITDLATQMGQLGDLSPLGVRRAHALGMLAQPQGALDLDSESSPQDADSGTEPHRPILGRTSVPATLFLHVSAADLATGATGGGRVEKLGAATLDLLRDWLQRVDRVTVRPVLDRGRDEAVDEHDPPGWMREIVILRDGQCSFPGCGIDARSCDLDHIEAYLSPDDGGPPGQTSVDNLACLCRRHHRLKTFTGWTYHRDTSESYTWTSPRGMTFTSTTAPKN